MLQVQPQLFHLHLLRDIAERMPCIVGETGRSKLLSSLVAIATPTQGTATAQASYPVERQSALSTAAACQLAAVQVLGLLAVHQEQAARVFMQHVVPVTIRGGADRVWQATMESYSAVKACWPALVAAVDAPAAHGNGAWQTAGRPDTGSCGELDTLLNVQRAHRLALMSVV